MRYMSSMLLRVAVEHPSVVAVAGKGPLQGMKKHWKQPVVMKVLLELLSQKPAFSTPKVLTSLGVANAGVAIISGIYFPCKKWFSKFLILLTLGNSQEDKEILLHTFTELMQDQ